MVGSYTDTLLITESEVVTGKSQTEALPYWPNDRDFKIWYGEAVVRRQIVKITSGDVMTRDPLRLSRRSLAFYYSKVTSLTYSSRWSGDVIKRPGHKNFNAVSHNRARPEVLFSNLTWRSRGQISSVLLPLLLFAFSIRKCGRHGKWSFTFWQWKYGRKFGVKELDVLDRWCWCWKSHLIGHAVEL